MGATTVAAKQAEVPADPVPSHDGTAEATRSSEELFQWSGYVHLGKGAEECEHKLDGECDEDTTKHFHAWVCLPNPYQVRDIADKARAAQARKARALRDPESDAYVSLEEELDLLREPVAYDALLTVLAQREIEGNLLSIIEELQHEERFEHHSQDAEELRRQEALPEDERDAVEYTRLQEDMTAYGEELQAAVDERQDTARKHLEAKSQDAVLDIERKQRIASTANEVYLHTYYTWAIFTGTRVPTTAGFPSQRKFKAPEDLKNAAPEAIVALREKIRTLEERTVDRGEAAGN